VRVNGRTYSYPYGLASSPRLLISAITTAATRSRRPEPTSVDEWFRREYGDRLAEAVAIPLVERWSGVRATELAPSVGEKLRGGVAHVLRLKLAARMTKRAVAHGYCREQPESVHVWHVYPEGSLGLLCERLASGLEDAIRLESPVEGIIVDGDRVVGIRVKGREQEVSAVMSTAPVHILAKLVEGTNALKPLARFKYRPMVFANLRFQGRGLLPEVVVWTPGGDYPFFRLTEAPLSMPWLAPEGKTMITADLGCEIGDATWKMSPEELGEFCVEKLTSIIPDARRRYLGCRVLRTPVAYPIFLKEYEAERRALEESTGVKGLYSIGRNGEFSHLLMEDIYWRTLRRVHELIMAA
jgi:protoporphyrinogen oxidase